MSLSVSFYNFSKRKNSTAIPSGTGTQYDVVLKNDTSLYTPTFVIGAGSFPSYSYAQFQNMYYYVTDIVKTTNQTYEAQCEIDPIGTERSAILGTTTWVSRTSASAYQNKWYIDNEVSVRPEIADVDQGSYNMGLVDSNGCYIMRVIGKEGIDTFIFQDTDLPDVLHFMFTDGNYLDGVQDALVKAVVNPFQYIVSFKYTPLKYSILAGTLNGAPDRPLYYGFWLCNVQDQQGNLVEYPKALYTGKHFGPYTLNMPANYYNDYGDYDPNITKAHISLPGGIIYEIPVDWLTLTLKCEFSFDIVTGQCQYLITDNGGHNLANFSSQICFEVQIGQSATDVSALATGAIGAAASAMAGSTLGVVASLTGAAKAALQPNPSINGQQQTATMIKAEPNIKIIASRRLTSTTPVNIGKPCNQNLTLSDLSGYFAMCPEASVICKLPQQYKDEINSTLRGGIYLN